VLVLLQAGFRDQILPSLLSLKAFQIPYTDEVALTNHGLDGILSFTLNHCSQQTII